MSRRFAFVLIFILAMLFSTAAFAQEETVVWRLDLQLSWFTVDAPFNQGGVPAGNVMVREFDNGLRGLHITNRGSDFQGADMRFRAGVNHMLEGDRIVLTGRVNLSEEEAQVRLERLPGHFPMGYFDINTDGTFEISHYLTEADEGLHAMRVSTTDTQDFFIYSFEVRRGEMTPDWDLTVPSIAEAFRDFFWMGTIWSCPAQMSDPATFDKFLHHYNTVTASNYHKVSSVLGSAANEWNWNFYNADAIVDWAEENYLSMDWHTLLWHIQSQAWLTNVPGTLEPLTRAEAIENMHRFISTVASRYSGRIFSWDVVNEAIYPRGTWGFNPDWRYHARRTGQGLPESQTGWSRWYDAFANGAEGDECGTDYIFYAFRFARRYDPFGRLYYNDYNEFTPVRREAIAQMTEQINERWRNDPEYDGRLLIEGIGMQSAQYLWGWPSSVSYIRNAIERFAETGAMISVTELFLRAHNVGATAPIPPELIEERFEAQAQRYTQLFGLYMEFSDYIERVNFFTWVDLPNPNPEGRVDHPSFFNIDRQTKPSFYAVMNLAERVTAAGDTAMLAANITIPEITTVSQDLPRGDVNENFAAMISAQQGNNAPTLWRVTEGSLPQGLRLVATTGVIIGTPEEEGVFTFTVEAENARGSGTRTLSMAVGDYEIEHFPEETVGEAEDELLPEPPAEATPPSDAEEPENDGVNPMIIISAIMVVLIAFLTTNKSRKRR